jgi:hypothetical protein
VLPATKHLSVFFNPSDEESESAVKDLPVLDSSTSTGPQTPSFSAIANVEDMPNANSTPLTSEIGMY